MAATAQKLRTVDVTQVDGAMVKPGELIDIYQDRELTLLERRIFNQLLQPTVTPEVAGDDLYFEIKLSELRGNAPNNNEVHEALANLQRTIMTIKLGPYRERHAQLLPPFDLIKDAARQPYAIRYRLDPVMVQVLLGSEIYARLDWEVMRAFRSKYGLTLYEMIARRVNLRRTDEVFTVEDLRKLLNVPDGKLASYGAFRTRALEVARDEMNLLAPFSCDFTEEAKQGRKVTKIRINWWAKSPDEMRLAYAMQMTRHRPDTSLMDADPVHE